MLLALGIVLRQIKRHRTIGIRLLWILKIKRGWKMAHKFGSKLFIISVVFLIACGLLSIQGLILPVILAIIILTCGYS
ncbi:SdpI family protein [Companilactobacillus kimchiensis]|uniref:SdpI family protein n=1 Tax=Companilactobacillus kimchiensis TaxID=993692 RepID=UPI00070D0B1B|nr:SdpI family protein [Companilactobacillus kimchiensis]